MRHIVVALMVSGLMLSAMGGWGPYNASAQEGTGKGKPSMTGGRPKEPTAALYFSGRLARIGLSKEQKEKIRAIFAAHDAVLADASARYIDKRRQLRMLMDDLGVAEESITALAAEIGQIEAELAIERNRVLKEVSGLLTSEQAAKFQKGRSAAHKKESGQPR